MALPPGCRVVCRPERKTDRRFRVSDLRRIAGYIFREQGPKELCEELFFLIDTFECVEEDPFSIDDLMDILDVIENLKAFFEFLQRPEVIGAITRIVLFILRMRRIPRLPAG